MAVWILFENFEQFRRYQLLLNKKITRFVGQPCLGEGTESVFVFSLRSDLT